MTVKRILVILAALGVLSGAGAATATAASASVTHAASQSWYHG